MLFEPASTVNTGNNRSSKTVADPEWIYRNPFGLYSSLYSFRFIGIFSNNLLRS